jgi:hypothetical protein
LWSAEKGIASHPLFGDMRSPSKFKTFFSERQLCLISLRSIILFLNTKIHLTFILYSQFLFSFFSDMQKWAHTHFLNGSYISEKMISGV